MNFGNFTVDFYADIGEKFAKSREPRVSCHNLRKTLRVLLHASWCPIPLPWLEKNDALPLATRGHRVKPLSLLLGITLSLLLAACRHSVMWGVFLLSFWCLRLSGLWVEHQNIRRPHRRAWVYRHAKSFQLCWIPCDLMDCSPPGSSVHGISQARILEWVAMPSSRESSWPRDRTHISYVSCISRWGLYHLCHLGSPYDMWH